MSLITITISGPPHSGKSAITQLIADRLRVYRLEVEVRDPDGPTEVEYPVRDQAQRLAPLEGTTVRIVQKTTRNRERTTT